MIILRNSRMVKCLVGVPLTASLVFATSGVAVAGTFESNSYQHASSQTQESIDIDQLASDLEFIFTHYLPVNDQGRVYVNEAYIKAAGYESKLSDFYALAYAVNSLDGKKQNSYATASVMGVPEFVECIGDRLLGFSVRKFPGILRAIREGVRARNWGLTARTVARIFDPFLVRALGGPARIAISLGAAALACHRKL
ncbi:hypothetical protein KJY78_01920 [Canibacter sp. lx-45]|uniref:hypothetical protein n=1 Tax=Canibacter zhuwentaonis TaxID=2837491 RepID=UPI001BDD84F3|nr:hypothetical protein [Canibacter zhuwentaonis]MBT1035113.1 hypothetical protein [Canibacter zhuwentaonis]